MSAIPFYRDIYQAVVRHVYVVLVQGHRLQQAVPGPDLRPADPAGIYLLECLQRAVGTLGGIGFDIRELPVRTGPVAARIHGEGKEYYGNEYECCSSHETA